jgi:hypothetical protein
MMATFDGFSQDNYQESDRKSVRSYKNMLFEATHAEDRKQPGKKKFRYDRGFEVR